MCRSHVREPRGAAWRFLIAGIVFVFAARAHADDDAAAQAAEEESREAAIWTEAPATAAAPETAPAPKPQPQAPPDALSIGGQLYLRLQLTGLAHQALGEYALNAPNLLDVYLDGRPNDRVRGFVLARVSYDPTLPRSSDALALGSLAPAFGTGAGALFSPGAPTSGPRFALDQIWLRFDIGRVLFVTAGKQHVRWGTGHFWSPTDYLHLQHKNPLDVFDARTGTSMLKLHLPIESLAWNLYGYALIESDTFVPTPEQIAFAGRAEIVLGNAELGLGALARYRESAKLAADLSIGIGPFDLYGELSALDSASIDRVGFAPYAPLPPPSMPATWQTPSEIASARLRQVVDVLYPALSTQGYKLAVVGGLSVSIPYNTNDELTIGAEYFYNQFGYAASPEVYPGLFLPRAAPLRNPASLFYLGQHYVAGYISLPAPFSLDDHTFAVSGIENFSDRSFIGRLDYSFTALHHLRVELYVSAHLGSYDGEFRLGVGPVNIDGTVLSRPPTVVDGGLALRLSI